MKSSPLSLACSLVFALSGAAHALPVVSTPLDSGSDQVRITQVAGGCGFGEHRGPYGGCRINNGPRGAIRRSLTGLPRGCPPGMHRGPYGRCRY